MKIQNGPIFPRIRGRVGEAFDNNTNEELGWTWEIFISLTIGEGDGKRIFTGETFPTQELALDALNKEVQKVTELIQETVDGKANGHYFDLKTNQLRKWK